MDIRCIVDHNGFGGRYEAGKVYKNAERMIELFPTKFEDASPKEEKAAPKGKSTRKVGSRKVETSKVADNVEKR